MKEKNFMKKKVNKKLLTFGVLGIFAIALVTGALLTYYGQIQQRITVNPSILINGEEEYVYESEYELTSGYEQKYTSKAFVITNKGDRNLDVEITTTSGDGIITSHDTVGLSTRRATDAVGADVFASLSGSVVTLETNDDKLLGGTTFLDDKSSASEARITIDAREVGVTTLSTLTDISWTTNVVNGYVAHVDVILDNGESLTFEYATLDSDCNAPSSYPTGSYEFIVNADAYAWESIPGACGVSTFDEQHNTLAEWIVSDGGETVLRFEIEVDAWVENSKSEISNIVINGNSKVIGTLSNPVTIDKAGGSKVFYVNSVIDAHIHSGTYPIITTVA